MIWGSDFCDYRNVIILGREGKNGEREIKKYDIWSLKVIVETRIIPIRIKVSERFSLWLLGQTIDNKVS